MIRLRVLAGFLAAACFTSFPAWSQSKSAEGVNGYPAKPVRMIVPLAPGGGSDIVARIVAQAMTQHWGQSVVVDNRPGAGATMGTAIAARSAPDGYSLLVTSSSHTIGAALYPNLWYDVVKDFEEITMLADQPSIVLVHPAVKAKTLKELIALLHAEPGKLGFGSAGQGTASHLSNELFLMAAGAKAMHVPYKSAGLAATALLGGEIQFMVTNMATAAPLARSSKVRGLAVTSLKRSPAVAELPTATEAGLAGFEYSTWYGMLAPAATPRKLVAQIHADTAKVLRSAQVTERFAAQGLEVQATTPQQFEAYVKSELDRWSRVIQTAGLKVQ
jgi:tripartite-type tricarboxylate transporter receptor subunit TctC